MDKQVKEELEVLEPLIGVFLQLGVVISAFIMLYGLAASWIFPGSPGFTPENLETLRNGKELTGAVVPQTLAAIRAGLLNWNAGTIVSLGIMALIALPILRVALTSILFMIKKDFLYFGLTVVVLVTLSFGILFGKGL